MDIIFLKRWGGGKKKRITNYNNLAEQISKRTRTMRLMKNPATDSAIKVHSA